MGNIVLAYELGKGSYAENKFVSSGKLRVLSDGKYEVFSREAINGSGEIAQVGDYIKIDSCGFPYPNEREFFHSNHKYLEGDRYEQIPKPLNIWMINDDICPEIEYIIQQKGLVMNPDDPQKYFTAPLGGTLESAAQDAIIVFYDIQRDTNGNIMDATFNFVQKGEFERTYSWIEE